MASYNPWTIITHDYETKYNPWLGSNTSTKIQYTSTDPILTEYWPNTNTKFQY